MRQLPPATVEEIRSFWELWTDTARDTPLTGNGGDTAYSRLASLEAMRRSPGAAARYLNALCACYDECLRIVRRRAGSSEAEIDRDIPRDETHAMTDGAAPMQDAYDRETEAMRQDAADEWTDTSSEEHAGHLDGLDAIAEQEAFAAEFERIIRSDPTLTELFRKES